MRAADIDHRLHGEEHDGLEHDAFARAPDVDDIGLVVEQAAEAVTAEVAHHAHVLGFHVALDRGADVAGGGAGADGGDAAHHGLVRHLDQAFGAARNFADGEHAAGIAVPAVEDQRHVDVDDVALFKRLVAGNAVADHVIERGAGRLLVAAIHQRRRQGAVIERIFQHQFIYFFGRHARLDMLDEHIETSRHQLPGLAHGLEGSRAVDLDLAGLAEGCDRDRKSTRLNSSHTVISYAVFCLNKKTRARARRRRTARWPRTTRRRPGSWPRRRRGARRSRGGRSGCRPNSCYFFNDAATTEIYTLSLHDALPISSRLRTRTWSQHAAAAPRSASLTRSRSEEHTSELQSHSDIVCRLLLEKKK